MKVFFTGDYSMPRNVIFDELVRSTGELDVRPAGCRGPVTVRHPVRFAQGADIPQSEGTARSLSVVARTSRNFSQKRLLSTTFGVVTMSAAYHSCAEIIAIARMLRATRPY